MGCGASKPPAQSADAAPTKPAYEAPPKEVPYEAPKEEPKPAYEAPKEEPKPAYEAPKEEPKAAYAAPPPLPDEDTVAEAELREEAIRVFNLADLDKDGNLNVDEVHDLTGFKTMATTMMNDVDKDVSGTLSLTEWVEYIVKKGPSKGKKTLQLYENSLTTKYGDMLDATPAAGLEAEMAAAKLQSIKRGTDARKEVNEMKETKAKQDDAAAKVQALYRSQAPAATDYAAAPAATDYAAASTDEQKKDEAAAKVQELYKSSIEDSEQTKDEAAAKVQELYRQNAA